MTKRRTRAPLSRASNLAVALDTEAALQKNQEKKETDWWVDLTEPEPTTLGQRIARQVRDAGPESLADLFARYMVRLAIAQKDGKVSAKQEAEADEWYRKAWAKVLRGNNVLRVGGPSWLKSVLVGVLTDKKSEIKDTGLKAVRIEELEEEFRKLKGWLHFVAHGRAEIERVVVTRESMEALVPREKQPHKPTHPVDTIAAAKREATRLRVAKLRKNKKSQNIRLTNSQNEKLKAIAAANNKNVQAYLEDLVAENITANEHLVPIGKEKLRQGGAPRRVRSKHLAEENARLRTELAKLKPT